MAQGISTPTGSDAAPREGGGWTFLVLLPAILGCVVLAAHFLRQFDLLLSGLCLLLPFLLLVRRAWVARLMQAAMLFAAVAWLGTLVRIVGERQAAGQPWVRLVVILGGVAAVSLAGGFLFETGRLRRRYGLRTAEFFRTAPSARGDR